MGNELGVCVVIDGEPGIVVPYNGKLQCCTCKYGRHSCQHVELVLSKLDDPEETILTNVQQALHSSQSHPDKQHRHKCLSTQQIPYNLQHILSMNPEKRFSLTPSFEAFLHVSKFNERCSQCDAELNSTMVPTAILMLQCVMEGVAKFVSQIDSYGLLYLWLIYWARNEKPVCLLPVDSCEMRKISLAVSYLVCRSLHSP